MIARSASYLEIERSAEILSIGSCVAAGIDEEGRAAFSGPIKRIGGKAK